MAILHTAGHSAFIPLCHNYNCSNSPYTDGNPVIWYMLSCVETENHATLLHGQSGYHQGSWAQHGGHISANRLINALSLGLQHTSLILYIHIMVNWQLSKQGIYWQIPFNHIAGLSLEIIKVNFFLELTTAQILVFDCIAGSSLVTFLLNQ